MEEYLKVNRDMWNHWAEAHVNSAFYDNESFKKGRNSLNDIELKHLGDISGKDLLHLQCHFGQDTLSLARMGAKVTGLDLSDVAIETARNLATELGIEADFICANVLEMGKHLDRQFDIIFNTYGIVGWHPDLLPWAQGIADHLKPGGEFHLTEFHPVVWMYNEDFTQVTYGYFNTGEIIEEAEGSYAAPDLKGMKTNYSWNQTLSDVISALLAAGLQLTLLEEYDYSPYPIFNESVQGEKGYQIKGLEGKLPLVYSIVAQKPH